MRKALLYLSLITFAIALVLLCSPASAAAENNRRREYVLREAPDPSLPDQACRMIITFKDDVLIYDDSSTENYELSGTDSDGDSRFDDETDLTLVLKGGSNAAGVEIGKAVFVQHKNANGCDLYLGKVKEIANGNTELTLATSTKEIDITDFVQEDDDDIEIYVGGSAYIEEREIIEGVKFSTANVTTSRQVSQWLAKIVLTPHGLGFYTNIYVNINVYDIKVDISKKISKSVSVPLLDFPFELIPHIIQLGDMSIDFDLDIKDVTGHYLADYNKYYYFGGWLGLGHCNMRTKEEHGAGFTVRNWEMNGALTAAITGEIQFGLAVPHVTDILNFHVKMGGGVTATASYDKSPYLDDGKIFHECNYKLDNVSYCMKGDLRPAFILKAWIAIVGGQVELFNASRDGEPFADFYHSTTFNEGGMTQCPHKGYRLNVNVTTRTGKCEGIIVTYKPLQEKYASAFSDVKTDNKGKATIYVPYDSGAGDDWEKNKITLQVIKRIDYPSTVIVSEMEYTEKGQADSVSLSIDDRCCTLEFKDATASHPTGLPDPIYFYPGAAEHLNLPAQVPSLPGYIFLGWCMKKPSIDVPIPKDTIFKPGEPFAPNDDTTLYAVWMKDGQDWFTITYHDNGGSGGPGTQLWPAAPDKEVRISMVIPEPPVAGQHFAGWNPSANNPDPSKTLQPDESYGGRDSIDLYAVWTDFPPIDPGKITFKANGDTSVITGVPPVQTIPLYRWSKLTGQIPVWDDQHRFLGWSRNPEDASGKYYMPGHHQFFSDDVILYAIWQREYHIVEKPADSAWLHSSGKTLRYAGDGPLKYFSQVMIDGRPAAKENYTISEASGKTVIELKPAYLETLADGEHSIRIVYDDGFVTASTDEAVFTVGTVHYTIVSGDGQKWSQGSGLSLTFVIKGDADDANTYGKFRDVRVNGTLLEAKNYKTEPGSLKLTLLPDYLETLSKGKAGLTITFIDGKAEGSFTIVKKTPRTGDDSSLFLWACLILLGAVGICYAISNRKCKNHSKY